MTTGTVIAAGSIWNRHIAGQQVDLESPHCWDSPQVRSGIAALQDSSQVVLESPLIRRRFIWIRRRLDIAGI